MLSAIGALTAEEHLTSLGRHLAHLPLNPAIGKVLLFGTMFRVLDPLLTVACRTANRSPFVLPSGARSCCSKVCWGRVEKQAHRGERDVFGLDFSRLKTSERNGLSERSAT